MRRRALLGLELGAEASRSDRRLRMLLRNERGTEQLGERLA